MKTTLLTLIFSALIAAGSRLAAQQADMEILSVNFELAGAASASVTGATDTFDVNITLFVNDTVNTGKLHVMLQERAGSVAFLSRVFNFDVATGLPAGTAFVRQGNIVTLTLGRFWELNEYQVKVRREDVQGNLGNAVIY